MQKVKNSTTQQQTLGLGQAHTLTDMQMSTEHSHNKNMKLSYIAERLVAT